MPVAQLNTAIQQTCPPPIVTKMAVPGNNVNQMPMNNKPLSSNLQQNGEMRAHIQMSSPQPMAFRTSPHQATVVMAPQMPPPLPAPPGQLINGNVPMMATPMVPVSPQKQHVQYSSLPHQPVQNVMMPPSPEVPMVSSGGSQMYPCISVPYMDSISLRQVNVNVNSAPSEDPAGKDLPLSDMNTLRFFFNLGVEYYRSVSTMSWMNNGGTPDQAPIVLCQSTNEKQATYVDATQTYDAVTVQTDSSQLANSGDAECHASPSHELDDKRSNASNDSGCESDHVTGTVIGSLGNACKSAVKGHISDNSDSKILSNENGLEKITACSDMSISDTTESLINDHELTTARLSKQRRKYYMYGNLKLIKPIKDIPKRFLNLLAATSAERQRCEGEPIILAAPNSYENQKLDVTDLQCFVPGFTSSKASNRDTNNNKEGSSNGLIESPSSACRSSNYCQSTLFVPSVPPSSVTPSTEKSSSTNTSCTRTPFYTGYSNPSYPPQVGTVYFSPMEQTGNPGAGIPQTYTMYHSPGPVTCTGLQQQTALTSYSVSHQVSSLAIAANQ